MAPHDLTAHVTPNFFLQLLFTYPYISYFYGAFKTTSRDASMGWWPWSRSNEASRQADDEQAASERASPVQKETFSPKSEGFCSPMLITDMVQGPRRSFVRGMSWLMLFSGTPFAARFRVSLAGTHGPDC